LNPYVYAFEDAQLPQSRFGFCGCVKRHGVRAAVYRATPDKLVQVRFSEEGGD